MSKVKIVSIIYAIGIIIGALFFDVWGADTTPFKNIVCICVDCNIYYSFIFCR